MDTGTSKVIAIPNQVEAPSRPLRVLVVDDDCDTRELLEEVVAQLGHQSEGAVDGREALAVQHARPVDVVLSDWCMPGMTGIELCRRLRACATPERTHTSSR